VVGLGGREEAVVQKGARPPREELDPLFAGGAAASSVGGAASVAAAALGRPGAAVVAVGVGVGVGDGARLPRLSLPADQDVLGVRVRGCLVWSFARSPGRGERGK